jgi:hypothetical protein
MIQSISWQGYWTFLAFSVTLYYGLVAVVFYAGDIKAYFLKDYHRFREALASMRAPVPTPLSSLLTEIPLPVEQLQEATTEEELLLQVRSLADELQAFLAGAADEHLTKAAIIASLSALLHKYPGVKGSAYQSSISELICFSCDHICSIHLSAVELERVWQEP